MWTRTQLGSFLVAAATKGLEVLAGHRGAPRVQLALGLAGLARLLLQQHLVLAEGEGVDGGE